MGRCVVSISPLVGRPSFSRTVHHPGGEIRATRAVRAVRPPATLGSEEALDAGERQDSSPSILDAFLINPVAFLAGAFVGFMELDVLSDTSAIAKVLRKDRV